MRIGLVCATFLLVSCGYSEAELEAEKEKARAEALAEADKRAETERLQLAAVQRREECLAEEEAARVDYQESMADARRTVFTALDSVDSNLSNGSGRAAYEWEIDVERLDSAEWSWVEEENTAATSGRDGAALLDRIVYEVDPKRLSSSVRVTEYRGEPAVLITCKSGNCMRARGRRIAYYNGRQQFADIDEGRGRNFWPMGTRNRAEILKEALSTLIVGAAGPPQGGNCEGSGVIPMVANNSDEAMAR